MKYFRNFCLYKQTRVFYFFYPRVTDDVLFSTTYLGYGTNIELKVYFDSNFQTNSITNVALPRPDVMYFEKYDNQNAAKFKVSVINLVT